MWIRRIALVLAVTAAAVIFGHRVGTGLADYWAHLDQIGCAR